MKKLKKKAGHVAVIWVPVNGFLNKLFCLGFIFNESGRGGDGYKQQIQEVQAMLRDVERLITWAKRAGIEELSFYDERGRSIASLFIVHHSFLSPDHVYGLSNRTVEEIPVRPTRVTRNHERTQQPRFNHFDPCKFRWYHGSRLCGFDTGL